MGEAHRYHPWRAREQPRTPRGNKHTHTLEQHPLLLLLLEGAQEGPGVPTPSRWDWERGRGSGAPGLGAAHGPGRPFSPVTTKTIRPSSAVSLESHASPGIAPFPEGSRLGVKGPAREGKCSQGSRRPDPGLYHRAAPGEAPGLAAGLQVARKVGWGHQCCGRPAQPWPPTFAPLV